MPTTILEAVKIKISRGKFRRPPKIIPPLQYRLFCFSSRGTVCISNDDQTYTPTRTHTHPHTPTRTHTPMHTWHGSLAGFSYVFNVSFISIHPLAHFHIDISLVFYPALNLPFNCTRIHSRSHAHTHTLSLVYSSMKTHKHLYTLYTLRRTLSHSCISSHKHTHILFFALSLSPHTNTIAICTQCPSGNIHREARRHFVLEGKWGKKSQSHKSVRWKGEACGEKSPLPTKNIASNHFYHSGGGQDLGPSTDSWKENQLKYILQWQWSVCDMVKCRTLGIDIKT